MNWETLKSIALEEVESILSTLPEPLRERAASLPVTFESIPNADHLRDGIAADTLGLFVGPEYAEQEITGFPVPPQIILFLENLWDMAEDDETIFREEVHITFLHELGHYLGLDEDGLYERGLE
jgi:predicted Zn-dependent protease with MMP-like domain